MRVKQDWAEKFSAMSGNAGRCNHVSNRQNAYRLARRRIRDINGHAVEIKGPKGTLSREFSDKIVRIRRRSFESDPSQ